MVAFRTVVVSVAMTCICHSAHATVISSEMIVEMREITSVSRSPDGARAVVGIVHPDPRTNTIELSWVIVSLQGNPKPIFIPAGEEIFDTGQAGGMLTFQVQWSPDGQWFYYLRRDGQEVQLWQSDLHGKVARQLTHSKSDLVGLSASEDPNELLVQLAPERELLNKAEDQESREGILYDDHVIGGFPLTRTIPSIDRWRNIRRMEDGKWAPPGWTGTTTAVFDIRRNSLIPQTHSAIDGLPQAARIGAMKVCRMNCVASHAYRATSVALSTGSAAHPDMYTGLYVLQLEPNLVAGKTAISPMRCTIAECAANRISVIGWAEDESEVYFVTDPQEGQFSTRFPGQAAMYAWNPKLNRVRLIYDGGGQIYTLVGLKKSGLASVPIIDHVAVVIVDSPDEPPKLIAINLLTAVSRTLLDPNSELRTLTHGHASWHTWPTKSRYPGRGIIVLPDNYQPDHQYPLVVTTYFCGHGFLHGGNSDNAPEFVAAHLGFMAICVDVPAEEIDAQEPDLSRSYPLACESVASLIADQVKAGTIDATRVGLTGQSFGGDFGTYCLAHGLGKDPAHGIAAAAFRSGSITEPVIWDLFDTAAWFRNPVTGVYARFGLGDPHRDTAGRWNELSVANKAADINTPVLIQASDTEYLTSLPMWSAMRDAEKAVEMHVFPEAPHRLMHPAQQWMNFERQIDWFRFWLKDEEDDAPSKQTQYVRWRHLREVSKRSTGASSR